MPDMIRKIFDSQIKEVDEKSRTLQFTITAENEDRDGEVVKASGGQFENYNKNPVVLWAHDYKSLPVGKTVSLKRQDKSIISTVQFPTKEEYEYADTVYKLCKGGYLNAVSIGFIPIDIVPGKNEKEPSRTFTKWEMLEYSIVPVPSNPEALRHALDEGLITIKEFEHITKPEETTNTIRVPNPKDKKSHDGHKIRTIEISAKEGISALYCIDDKIIITYLFDKDKKDWTMADAKKWVEEHSKDYDEESVKSIDYNAELARNQARDTFWQLLDTIAMCVNKTCSDKKDMDKPASLALHGESFHGGYTKWIKDAKKAGLFEEQTDSEIPMMLSFKDYINHPLLAKKEGQAQVADEIDYILKIVQSGDLSDANFEAIYELGEEIRRLSGADIPVEIVETKQESIQEHLKNEIKRQLMEV